MITDAPASLRTSTKTRLAIRQDPETMVMAIWIYCGLHRGDLTPDIPVMTEQVLQVLRALQERLEAFPPATGGLGNSPRRTAVAAVAALWHFCDLDYASGQVPSPAQAAAEIAAFIRLLGSLCAQSDDSAAPSAAPVEPSA